MKKYNIAILGATGAVGKEMLKVLNKRNFPINELRLLASKPEKKLNMMDKNTLFKRQQKIHLKI
jgi:aspartate-semialdehyde dehydrogenase